MSRGKWKTTMLKEHIQLAQIEAEAVRLAAINVEQKIHEKKSLLDSFREHIGKFIDRADPVELLVLGAGTVVIHDVLKSSVEVLNKIGSMVPEGVTIGFPYSLLAQYALKYANPDSTVETSSREWDANSLFLWAIAFILAYIVVKHPEVIAQIGGVAKLALLFI